LGASQGRKLGRDAIIDAALELAADVGFETINIRAVAARLNCTAMALYRHVKDKDDLLQAMADRAIGTVEPPAETADWIDWYVAIAVQYWRMMRRYPGLDSYILTRGPVVATPKSVAISTQMIEVLLEAGFSAERASFIWQIAHTYLAGHSMLTRSDRYATNNIIAAKPRAAEVFTILSHQLDEDSLERGLRHILGGFPH
jgi:AcrR family transcriptional regulator